MAAGAIAMVVVNVCTLANFIIVITLQKTSRQPKCLLLVNTNYVVVVDD